MTTTMSKHIRYTSLTCLAMAIGGLASMAAPAAEPEHLEAVTIRAVRATETEVGRTGAGIPVMEYELSYRVAYGDLDLASDSGAKTLKQRVRDAAKSACVDLDKLYRLSGKDRHCAEKAEQGAMAEVDEAIATARRQ
jgi:UrcA family protein